MAAQMGRTRKLKIRKDWEAIKESVMLEALEAKFNSISNSETCSFPPATLNWSSTLKVILIGATEATVRERTVLAYF